MKYKSSYRNETIYKYGIKEIYDNADTNETWFNTDDDTNGEFELLTDEEIIAFDEIFYEDPYTPSTSELRSADYASRTHKEEEDGGEVLIIDPISSTIYTCDSALAVMQSYYAIDMEFDETAAERYNSLGTQRASAKAYIDSLYPYDTE